jgi:hypothetical protein
VRTSNPHSGFRGIPGSAGIAGVDDPRVPGIEQPLTTQVQEPKKAKRQTTNHKPAARRHRATAPPRRPVDARRSTPGLLIPYLLEMIRLHCHKVKLIASNSQKTCLIRRQRNSDQSVPIQDRMKKSGGKRIERLKNRNQSKICALL